MRLSFKLAVVMAMAACASAVVCAQDLAPRAYLITPLHANAVTLTWSFYDGGVNFNGPGADYFSTRLLHLVKGNEFSRGFDSCFLFELSLRRIEWIFLFLIFTFGYRACSGVFIFPKGSSRMDEEYL
jgi:hypothetical protein